MKAFLLSLSLLLAACGQSNIPHRDALDSAVHTLVAQLSDGDVVGLWQQTDTATQEALEATLAQLALAREAAPKVWSDDEVQAALKALGADFLSDEDLAADDRGPRLLKALIRPESLSLPAELEDALSIRTVTIEQNDRAIVTTAVGEVFRFQQEGDAWRALFVQGTVADSPTLISLREHAEKTLALAKERHRRWVESLDPREPQGAYNLARRAQAAEPRDLDALFSLLDREAHDALHGTLEAGRQLQRRIQRGTPKNARPKAYEDAGIDLIVASSSDLDLFRRWGQTEGFTPPLPSLSPPDEVNYGDNDRQATVITETDKIPLTQGDDGLWRIQGFAEAITKGLSPQADDAP